MKIQVRGQTDSADTFLAKSAEKFFAKTAQRLVAWEFVCSGEDSDQGLFDWWECSFYLGWSQDKTLYGLLKCETRYDNMSVSTHLGSVVALLRDPEEMNESTVACVLLRAYREAGGRHIEFFSEVGPYQLDENMGARLVQDLFPEAPQSWCLYPAMVEVGFNLIGGVFISKSDFDAYKRRDFISAAQCFFGMSTDGLFLVYSLKANGAASLLEWDVTWPLSRRGTTHPERRGPIEGDIPGHYRADPTLIELSQQPGWDEFGDGDSLFRNSMAILRVGGRTPEEAIHNWEHCAKILRREKKRTRSSRKTCNHPPSVSR